MCTLSMRIVTRRKLRQSITIENSNILANFRIKSKSLEILILRLCLIYAKKSPSKISRLGTFNLSSYILRNSPYIGDYRITTRGMKARTVVVAVLCDMFRPLSKNVLYRDQGNSIYWLKNKSVHAYYIFTDVI
jgi:hypothetical protein